MATSLNSSADVHEYMSGSLTLGAGDVSSRSQGSYGWRLVRLCLLMSLSVVKVNIKMVLDLDENICKYYLILAGSEFCSCL